MIPDLHVLNVILGTKRLAWDGPTSLECPESGYRAECLFSEERWTLRNVVKGTIYHNSSAQPLFSFAGNLGGIITLTPVQERRESEVLLDMSAIPRYPIIYRPPELMDPLESLLIWKEVNKHIVVYDMENADRAKIVIEQAQRVRRKDGTSFVPRFFHYEKEQDRWNINNINFEPLSPNIVTEKDIAAPAQEQENIRQEEAKDDPRPTEENSSSSLEAVEEEKMD